MVSLALLIDYMSFQFLLERTSLIYSGCCMEPGAVAAAGKQEIREDRIALGIALVLLSTLFTSLTDAFFKFATAGGTVWQYFVWRSLIAIPVLLGIALLWGDGIATWRVLQAR